jgi:hypothetical protein
MLPDLFENWGNIPLMLRCCQEFGQKLTRDLDEMALELL